MIVPYDRLDELPDEDGIESDGRPYYRPAHRLCGVLDADNGHLVTDLALHPPDDDEE
ncbi:hypothetical protein [Streptomyces buecherae]|uniref:hypothetical protein n=1 Tax=Streptomyces buecherae TaxID=2763006 RepID=UPI0036A307ED